MLDSLFDKPTIEDRYEFFYVWQMYADFGIRAEEAVTECAKSAKKESVREIMNGLLKEIKNGASMADAMKKYPQFFPAYAMEMVRVGERSGQLNSILSNLVFSLEHEMDMEKDIRSAMWMPKIFIVLLGIVFAVLTFYVIPKIGDVLGELNMELPLITAAIIGFGNIMLSYWYLFVALIVALFFGVKYFLKQRPDVDDSLHLKMPILGAIYRTKMQFRLASILGMCLEAGLPVRSSIRFAAAASESYFMRGTLHATLRRMEASGASFLDALHAENTKGVVPSSFFLLVRAGSKGNLGEVMLHLADRWQKDILRLSKQVGDKIAFSVILPAALVLILLLFSIEYPIWGILGNNTDIMGAGGGM